MEAVRDWPVPNSVSEVRSFLGFVNYFRRFIPRYAELARYLDEITGKHAHFSWNESRQKSFESLKSALLNAPVLQLADTSRPFILHTDASDLAIGAVLIQADELEQHPVAYASRKLTSAERNYTIAERETLAVVFALQTWKFYLFKHFDIFTDNQAVVYIRSKPHLSKREARWAEFLAEFNFSTRHIPGKENTADSLSRQSEPRLWAELGSLEFSLDLHPDEAKEIEDGYADDRELTHIVNRLRSVGDNDSFRDKYFWDEENKRLYLIDSSPARLCIAKGSIRLKILRENHDCISPGHQGRDRTFWNLSRHFYWPGMGRSVKDFVQTCDSSQRNKCAGIRTGLLQPISIPVKPWESISMDFVMGLPKTERQHDAIFYVRGQAHQVRSHDSNHRQTTWDELSGGSRIWVTGGRGILRPQNLWSRSDHGEGLPSPPVGGPGACSPGKFWKLRCADMHFSLFWGIISEKSESEFAR